MPHVIDTPAGLRSADKLARIIGGNTLRNALAMAG